MDRALDPQSIIVKASGADRMPGIYLFPVAGTSSVKKDPYTKIKRQEITFLVKRFIFQCPNV